MVRSVLASLLRRQSLEDFVREELEDYVTDDTKNPYYANAAKKFAEQHMDDPDAVKNFLDNLRRCKDATGFLKVFSDNLAIASLFSGGGAKGVYYTGTIEAYVEFNLVPSINGGVSIGAIASAVLALTNNRIELPGVNQTPEEQREFSQGILGALGTYLYPWSMDGGVLVHNIPRLAGIGRRLAFSRTLADTEGIREYLNDMFGDIKLNDVEGYFAIASNYPKGENPSDENGTRVVYSKETHPDELLVDVFMRTIAYHNSIKGFEEEDETVSYDGAHTDKFPVDVVFDMGAHLVLGNIIPEGDERSFLDFFDQRVNETVGIKEIGLKYILKNGDPMGRLLIAQYPPPELSIHDNNVGENEFEELYRKGKLIALDQLFSKLGPEFRPPLYDSDIFLLPSE